LRLNGSEAVVTEISPWLLAKLVCPLSKARVVQAGDWIYSTDPHTRRRYPICDGICTMLIEESEVVELQEFRRIMALGESQGQRRSEPDAR
jgi:uncharacterized protein YbaR (Trm112 family)